MVHDNATPVTAPHTPGRWTVFDLDGADDGPIWHAEVRALAGTNYRTVALMRSLEHQTADARLIAEAPAMLDVLDDLLGESPCSWGLNVEEASDCGYAGCLPHRAVRIVRRVRGLAPLLVMGVTA